MRNKSYFLALNYMNRVGPRTILKLLKRWPDLQELFELPQSALVLAGLPEALAHAIATFDHDLIAADFRWEEARDHHLLTWDDPNYPPLLKEIDDPPAVLYAKGSLSALAPLTVAMVGTRKPSATGAETARYFARELSQQGITVVSGLALGIDAQAHQGCLDVGGKTIAVMGTGIDCIYPYRHRDLANNISQDGLLITEFSLKTTPNAGHFPRRNRIISGLARLTLIVEAAIKSGSLITARLAMEQNRDVLAIPGSINNPQARGCHQLLQQGAKLVTSVQDVLDELPKTNRDYLSDSIRPLMNEATLAPENRTLVKCIGDETTSIDQIVERCGQTIREVTCGLARLELQGVIKAVTGGYMRCLDERKLI